MLEKQAIEISFAQGLDTKTDPKRVAIGKFRQMVNRVYNKEGLLEKRNGYAKISALPDTTYSYVTTFNDNLTALGTNVAAYNEGSQAWVSRGAVQPVALETLPVLRNNLNQSSCDVAIASNGTACAVYLESDGSTTTAKYVVFDSVTGQNLKAPAVIPVASGTVTGGCRVFVLGNNFILAFTNVITAVSHLQYVTVNIKDPTVVGSNTDIAASYIATGSLSWDGYVFDNNLYIAYYTTTGGQQIKVTYLTAGGTLATPVSFATYAASIMSVTVDSSVAGSPAIWATFYRSDTHNAYTVALDQNLNTLSGFATPVNFITSGTYANMCSVASGGALTVYAELVHAYSWTSNLTANVLERYNIVQSTAAITSFVSIRGLGLASKPFFIGSTSYFLATYSSPYQNTYFLINGSATLQTLPVVVAKLAYENGGGALTKALPSVTVSGTTASIGYLFKDLIQAVNKNTAVPAGTQTAGIFSQTGVNLASFTFGTDRLDTAEIGNDLHMSGGFLWMYDGYLPVEHGFALFPDVDTVTPANTATWSATGGSMAAQPNGSTNTNAYYYIITYEWTDNQGNAFRSAPSIPTAVTTTGALSTGSVTINVPTLRVTAKVANAVKIVIYRWSVAQQNYYQVTSITSPTLNNTTADTVTYTDTSSDATILGNNLLYTTGGVVENIAAPATNILALFDTRLWLVNAENPNELWYSKQVIQDTPAEMSDLFTTFVPPTTSTAGSTGPIRSLAVMDDKLIIGKRNAFLYINGTGPDNTGANSQYSQPIFITATVGCENQRSFALTPQGLMFQSDKGIWLLDRGLGTNYIGAAVEEFTQGATVTSAVVVPETNQVRFTLDTGITLMYDYFYGQWGVFTGVPAVSSCIYQDMHTFINSYGFAYQESPGTYVDGSNPVLTKWQTGPLRLGDLQGYQRVYFFYLLGTFISPHKLQVSLTYDYASSPSQTILITPGNYSTPFGGSSSSDLSQSPFGQQSTFGGPSSLEDWRIFPMRQRCMAVSVTVEEIFDASYGTAAGAGYSCSGLSAVCGFKKGFRPQPTAKTVG